MSYISSLKNNLISIGQLDSKDYATVFGKSSWKIVKGAMVVACSTKSGTLYTIGGCMNIATVVESAPNSSIWHKFEELMNVRFVIFFKTWTCER